MPSRYTKYSGSSKDAASKFAALNKNYPDDRNPYNISTVTGTTTETKCYNAISGTFVNFKPGSIPGTGPTGNGMFASGVDLTYLNSPSAAENPKIKVNGGDNEYKEVPGAPLTRFTPDIKSPGAQTTNDPNLLFAAKSDDATNVAAAAAAAFLARSSGDPTASANNLPHTAPSLVPALPGDIKVQRSTTPGVALESGVGSAGNRSSFPAPTPASVNGTP